ncbi:MAG: hypothetical protein J3K34DRAFT_516818 [Monoraphidium minutum]|nr:MAG: hypothetical protein J3K34DRAFT_516818 [Monoraphidium minutum]
MRGLSYPAARAQPDGAAAAAAPACPAPCRGGGATPPVASLCAPTLRLRPAAAEAAFWEASGGLCVSVDRGSLPASIVTMLAIVGARTLPAQPCVARPPLLAACLALAAHTLWVWRLAARRPPAEYVRVREAHMVVERLLRGALMLAFLASRRPAAWSKFFARISFESGSDAGAEWALAAGLLSVNVPWILQALLLPVRFRVAAPLHAALCMAGAWAARPAVCVLRADASMAAAAARLWRRAEGAKATLLVLAGSSVPWAAGGGAGGGGGGAAAARAAGAGARGSAPSLESLFILVAVAAVIAPMAILYTTELRLKLAFLRARGSGKLPASCGCGGPVGRLLAAVAVALVGFIAVDALAALWGPVACAAAAAGGGGAP